jgi:sporulation protein YlmC with PRC-barrel domain
LPDRLSGHAPDVSVEGQGEFAGSGAVGRYWQTHCRGFEVRSPRGRRLGFVEALELDRETGAVSVLLVRRRRRKRLRLRPEAVSVVDPWRRSLVVAALPRRRRRPVASLPRVQGARRFAPAARRVLLFAALAVWIYAQVVFTIVQLVVRLLVALTIGTARSGVRLKPHLHGAK